MIEEWDDDGKMRLRRTRSISAAAARKMVENRTRKGNLILQYTPDALIGPAKARSSMPRRLTDVEELDLRLQIVRQRRLERVHGPTALVKTAAVRVASIR